MDIHKNARLSFRSREALARYVMEQGATRKAAAAGTDAVFLHEPLHPLLAHANAALDQLPPDPRPSIGAAKFCVHRAVMRQQSGIAQMPA